MSLQLTLDVHLKDDATFNNFFVGDNQTLLQALKEESFFYVWGKSGLGKTHLLQAMCHYINSKNSPSVYLPLKKYRDFSPEILLGLEFQSLICLDDIESIVGNAEWEEALFYFYNRAVSQSAQLVISADKPPKQLAINLLDLKSRLTAGFIFQMKSLSDEHKLGVLQLHAKHRGLFLSEEVGNYLLVNYDRELSKLIEALNKLDQASLSAQRKLTIPFVKQILI